MINGAVYKHVKRGGFYVILTRDAISQNEDPNHDNVKYVVYQSLKDQTVWVRPLYEFFDGRFKLIDTNYGFKS